MLNQLFIARSCNSLSRDRVFHLLDGYSAEQIAVYIKAFDFENRMTLTELL
jgi:hypothetical protein